MGTFSKRIQDAKLQGGGLYLEEGDHELEIVQWKAISVRKTKDMALVVDFRVIKSPVHTVGSIRNFYAGEADEMFDQKAKGLCIAAMGFVPGKDDALIAKENWDTVLETSIAKPIFIGNKVNCTGVRLLKKAGKDAARKDPTLVDDAVWYKQNSFIRLDFAAHEETRAKALALVAKK